MPSIVERVPRPIEEKSLVDFLSSTDRSGFAYLRGRRRVGKSDILEKIEQELPGCFYFTGIRDESSAVLLQRFASKWAQFSNTPLLESIDVKKLNWTLLFGQIEIYIKSQAPRTICLLLDEVQWIAKSRTGFVGQIKLAWQHLERIGNVKIILCGSSNRFFSEYTGGEETILRGLRTHADLWIKPFSLKEVWQNWGQRWSLAEAAFVYCCLGGVPYYLNMLPRETGFMVALNDAAFIASSPLLTEVDEVLRLEFNSRSITTVKKILSQLGMSGRTEKDIAILARLPQSTVSEALDKLQEYGIVYVQEQFGNAAGAKNRGVIYEMRDFYLNFYFSVLAKQQRKITCNQSALILPDLLPQSPSLYLPNFSGRAFEHFVRMSLADDLRGGLPISRKLRLSNDEIGFSTYRSSTRQIDLVLSDAGTRTIHAIECKWSFDPKLIKEDMHKLQQPGLDIPAGYQLSKHIVAPIERYDDLADMASRSGVSYWDLRDFCA